MWGRALFKRRATAPPQPTPSKARAADQSRREKQDTRLFARAADLAPWLISIEEADGLSYRRVCALYHEFCELRDLQPLDLRDRDFARPASAPGASTRTRAARPARAGADRASSS